MINPAAFIQLVIVKQRKAPSEEGASNTLWIIRDGCGAAREPCP
jgi:hypothetical protein